jgi:Fe-S oxidoreductase
MSLEDVKELLYGCSRCGTCKEVLRIFDPSCPPGEKYKKESFYPSGMIAIARGINEGVLPIEDDDIRERIYSCTGCLSCQQQCAVYHHDHIFEIVQSVREEAVTRGLMKPEYMAIYYGLRGEDNVFGNPKSERGDWAKDIDVKNAAQENVEVLYHAGCILSYEEMLRNVPESVMKLMKAAGVDVGIMGAEECCCGGRSYEIGYTGEFTKYAEHSIETFNAIGVSKVVTSCSDGYATFKNLYQKIDTMQKYETLHFVEFLSQLIADGKLKLDKEVPMMVTYHDPCHLGRHLGDNALYDAPREVLNGIPGIELVEMKRNRENAWCCGAGAGVSQANTELSLWTANERLKEAKSTGATALVTCCPWCEKNFKDAVAEYGTDIEIYDIAEIACKAL